MDEYISRANVQKVMEFVTNDCTCPLHIAAQIDQLIAQEPAADVAPRSEVALEIIGEIWASHTPDIDGFFTMHETELVNLKKKYMKEGLTALEDKITDATERSELHARMDLSEMDIEKG